MIQRLSRFRQSHRLVFESLESRRLLAADAMFCVPASPTVMSEDVASMVAAPLPPAIGPVFTPLAIAPSSLLPEGEALPIASTSPFDPNGDGLVAPLDALLVLIHISRVNQGTAQNDAAAIARFDTSGDGDVAPVDALRTLIAISRFSRNGFGSPSVPLVSWINEPTSTNQPSTTDDLSMRLTIAAGVTSVFASMQGSGDPSSPINLSGLIDQGVINLPHAEVVSRFNPTRDENLTFTFWIDAQQIEVSSRVAITWVEASDPGDVGLLWTENAENGLTHIIDRTQAGYPLIQSTLFAQGASAFHLAHPTASDDWFEIDQTITLRADSQLFFMSRLGWATPTQVAKVQLSTDGGQSWPFTVYSQAGSDDSGEDQFVFRTVDLTAHAGQSVRLRFYYDFTGGLRFPETNPTVGWVVDDIRIASRFESTAYSIGEPTDLEQLFLEYTNRARADAIVEANRLAAETQDNLQSIYQFFGILPANLVGQYTASVNSGFLDRHAQPLAFNATLLAAARLHSQDLLTNAFQGHTSSANPPAPFQPGFTPTQRAAALGYQGGVGENVYSFAESIAHAHAGFAVDWGDETPSSPDYNPAFAGQGMQNPAGHRRNIHAGSYNEVGFGVLQGSNGLVGPLVVTQNFSGSGGIMITGVVYQDLDGDAFYDPGEGQGGVRIEVQGEAFHAVSAASGGYAIPVSGNGQYLVTFSGDSIETWSTQIVVANNANVKLDYVMTT